MEFCPHCGSKITARKESLSRGLMDTLYKFADATTRIGKAEIHLQKDTHLTKNQYNNFQKLRYFGLVAKGSEPGKWLLTSRGRDFLLGGVVSKHVWVQNNRVVRRSDATIKYQGIYEPYWLKREDYADQKGLF